MYHSSGKTLLLTSTTILSANTACLPTLAFVEKTSVLYILLVISLARYLYRYPNNLLACRRNQSSSAGRAYHCIIIIIIISGSITTTIIIIIRIIILKTDLELNQKDREPATNIIIISIKSICLSSSECSSTSFEEISV